MITEKVVVPLLLLTTMTMTITFYCLLDLQTAVASLGGGADRPGVTPSRRVTSGPDEEKMLWLNLQRTVNKRGGTGKKVRVTPSRGVTPE